MCELIQVSDTSYYIQSPAKIGLVKLSDTEVCLIDSGSDKDAGRKVPKLYRAAIQGLVQNKCPTYENIRETEIFWNQIMMEHALFIRGLLDPSEEQLIAAADGFAADYSKFLKLANQQDCRAMDQLTRKSLEKTPHSPAAAS